MPIPAPAKTVPDAPAWLNLHALVDEPTCIELRQLGDRVEEVIEDLAPLFDQCYRALRRVHGPAAASTDEPDVWEVVSRYSGARRLSDLLYLLAGHVDGACGENTDGHDIEWLAKARAEFGLDEWNMPLHSPEQP